MNLWYSFHATDRALARRLPILTELPESARLADRDLGASVFKIPATETDPDFFLVVSDDRVVITTFARDSKEWNRWRAAKERRRQLELVGVEQCPTSSWGRLPRTGMNRRWRGT